MDCGYLDMLKMNPEAKLIKLIVSEMVGSKEKNIRDLLSFYSINWGRFKDLIIYHELTPFTYFALKDCSSFLPQDLIAFLRNSYYCSLARCQYLWKEFLRIYDAFEQAGIILLPIKGVALLEDLYPDRPLRPMTDLDFLIREENLLKAEEIFRDLEYRKELYGLKEEYWRKNQYHVTFYHRQKQKKLPFVELHWSLDYKRKNRNLLPKSWDRIRQVSADGRIIKLLSPEDTLFCLALHNRRFGKTLCLKNVYDLVLLLNKYATDFDWEYCLKMNIKYSMSSTVYFVLYQIRLLSEINLPQYIWKELRLPRWKKKLIQRFIEANTFLPMQKIDNKSLYLKSHFLLYDTLWEPIEYILNIPKEQFAKYYGLNAYDKKTELLYQNRFLYIPFKTILNLVSRTD